MVPQIVIVTILIIYIYTYMYAIFDAVPWCPK